MSSKLARDGKAVNGCLVFVRKLPMERYKLPTDGRKWKAAARYRAALLLYLASFANGDGTFTRERNAVEINYSPSLKNLTKHFDRSMIFLRSKELRSLGLLSWERRDHYNRRIYTIHMENRSDIQNNRSDIRENRSDGQDVITGLMDRPIPSLDTTAQQPPQSAVALPGIAPVGRNSSSQPKSGCDRGIIKAFWDAFFIKGNRKFLAIEFMDETFGHHRMLEFSREQFQILFDHFHLSTHEFTVQ